MEGKRESREEKLNLCGIANIYIYIYMDGLINYPRLILDTGNLYKFDVIPCLCNIPEY